MMFYRGRASEDVGPGSFLRIFEISEKTLEFQAFDWAKCEVARQSLVLYVVSGPPYQQSEKYI
jgi:hypothetical protein